MLRDYAHYRSLTRFKETQAIENRNYILRSLHLLNNPSSVDEIYNHFRKMTEEKINRLYDSGKIDSNKKKVLLKEGTLNKRTIHRWLNVLIDEGLVERVKRKYSISEYGKNIHLYMAREKGDSALFALMRRYHPQVSKFESNVQELVKIFGIYLMYCFIDAAYPLYHPDKSRTTIMIDMDRHSDSYVDSIVHPLSLFNMFLAVISGLRSDELVQWYRDNRFRRVKNDKGILEGIWVDDNENQVFPADAYHLLLRRLKSEENSFDKVKRPMHELDEELIERIKKVLKKKYRIYYNSLFEGEKPKTLGEPSIRDSIEDLRMKRINFLNGKNKG